MTTRCHYEPLSSQSTRVVTILGGPPTAPIRCKFCVLPPWLGKAWKSLHGRAVDYEALSYVWGPLSQPAEVILCDGQPLSITANLADAIRSLRLPDRPRPLWIDQIGINQNDMAERSKQVLLMRDIYRNADRVISWLGPDPEANAPAALRFLREIADGHFKDVGDRFAPALQGFLSKHGLPDIGAAEWMSIDALLGLPYFTRVWILQEVILARRLTFLWGHIEISQELLAEFLN